MVFNNNENNIISKNNDAECKYDGIYDKENDGYYNVEEDEVYGN